MDRKQLIENVAKILWDNEQDLSDGYAFYTGDIDDPENVVTFINMLSMQIVDMVLDNQ